MGATDSQPSVQGYSNVHARGHETNFYACHIILLRGNFFSVLIFVTSILIKAKPELNKKKTGETRRLKRKDAKRKKMLKIKGRQQTENSARELRRYNNAMDLIRLMHIRTHRIIHTAHKATSLILFSIKFQVRNVYF